VPNPGPEPIVEAVDTFCREDSVGAPGWSGISPIGIFPLSILRSGEKLSRLQDKGLVIGSCLQMLNGRDEAQKLIWSCPLTEPRTSSPRSKLMAVRPKPLAVTSDSSGC